MAHTEIRFIQAQRITLIGTSNEQIKDTNAKRIIKWSTEGRRTIGREINGRIMFHKSTGDCSASETVKQKQSAQSIQRAKPPQREQK